MSFILSSWIWVIISIYGEDESFTESLQTYLGNDADYYIEHRLFDGLCFASMDEKKFNKIITSIVRAFLDSYDSDRMNKYYLEAEDNFKDMPEINTMVMAHIITQLRKVHDDLYGKLFTLKKIDPTIAILKKIDLTISSFS
jgi:hypothetical protein